jgi:hypothetical protein
MNYDLYGYLDGVVVDESLLHYLHLGVLLTFHLVKSEISVD